MEFIKPNDDMAVGLLTELVARFREQDSAEKEKSLKELFVKLYGLVEDLLDASAPQGLSRTYAHALFIVGAGTGRTKKRTLKEICSVSENSSAMYAEEEALKILAFDVSQKVFDDIRKRYEDHPHADAPFDINKHIVKKHLEPIRLGRKAVSDIFYSYKWGRGGGKSADGDDENRQAEPAATGETPEEQLVANKAREYLFAITKALVCAMRELRSCCEESFNYLLALIEATLILRAVQTGRSASDITETVHQDMSPLFVDAFREMGVYNHTQYRKVFNEKHDPFIRVKCVGTTVDVRAKRSRARDKLLELFIPLLAFALTPVCPEQDVQDMLRAIYGWLKDITWTKPCEKVTL